MPGCASGRQGVWLLSDHFDDDDEFPPLVGSLEPEEEEAEVMGGGAEGDDEVGGLIQDATVLPESVLVTLKRMEKSKATTGEEGLAAEHTPVPLSTQVLKTLLRIFPNS
jgi:hypothetical protein